MMPRDWLQIMNKRRNGASKTVSMMIKLELLMSSSVHTVFPISHSVNSHLEIQTNVFTSFDLTLIWAGWDYSLRRQR